MGFLRSTRFWALTVFAVALVVLGALTVIVGIWVFNTAPQDWKPDRLLAAEGLVLTASSLVATLIAAILALAAFALASERPKLRLKIGIGDDYFDATMQLVLQDRRPAGKRRLAASAFHWDNPGPVLWIRLYNDKGFSARNPAVRVETIGFRANAGERKLALTQGEWKPADPISPGDSWAWIWDGAGPIHGPRWFRDLPELHLEGLSPALNASKGRSKKCSISIVAVAEGDQVTQTIRFRA
jgi:hypothetical protein